MRTKTNRTSGRNSASISGKTVPQKKKKIKDQNKPPDFGWAVLKDGTIKSQHNNIEDILGYYLNSEYYFELGEKLEATEAENFMKLANKKRQTNMDEEVNGPVPLSLLKKLLHDTYGSKGSDWQALMKNLWYNCPEAYLWFEDEGECFFINVSQPWLGLKSSFSVTNDRFKAKVAILKRFDSITRNEFYHKR